MTPWVRAKGPPKGGGGPRPRPVHDSIRPSRLRHDPCEDALVKLQSSFQYVARKRSHMSTLAALCTIVCLYTGHEKFVNTCAQCSAMPKMSAEQITRGKNICVPWVHFVKKKFLARLFFFFAPQERSIPCMPSILKRGTILLITRVLDSFSTP